MWPRQRESCRAAVILVYTVHCTLYTVHCTLYTVHCKLYTVQYSTILYCQQSKPTTGIGHANSTLDRLWLLTVLYCTVLYCYRTCMAVCTWTCPLLQRGAWTSTVWGDSWEVKVRGERGQKFADRQREDVRRRIARAERGEKMGRDSVREYVREYVTEYVTE